MGSVQPKKAERGGKKAGWRAMWRDHEGRQRSKTFDRKIDAERHLSTVEADLLRGTYIDPRAGQVTLAEYAEQWMAAQVWRPTTRDLAESHMRNHIGPALGHRRFSTITPTDVQSFVRSLDEKGLAPRTVASVHRRLVSIFEAAVRDRRIAHSPAEGITLPKAAEVRSDRVVALDLDDVRAIAGAVPPWLTALVWTMATTGLRPAEAVGLTVERIDLERRTVRVDRQLITRPHQPPYLAPPKTAASVRDVPIVDTLVDELTRHMKAHPPLEFDEGATLIFTNRDSKPLRRQALGDSWQSLRRRHELRSEARGWHTLRHTYASWLIQEGLSVKTVQARLGHRTATETLETYAHLWPSSDDDTRAAIDARLRPDETPID